MGSRGRVHNIIDNDVGYHRRVYGSTRENLAKRDSIADTFPLDCQVVIGGLGSLLIGWT